MANESVSVTQNTNSVSVTQADNTVTVSTTTPPVENEEVQDVVGGMVTGNTETGITVTYEDSDGTLDFVVASQTDENFTSADHTKLDGIEANATADQTAEEIQDMVGAMLTGNTETGITVTYEDGDGTIDFVVASQTDENFTSADHTKLDGIEAGATADQDLSSYATQSYVGTQITNLIDSSPAALNTLNELAAALGDDASFSTTVTNSIATKLPLAGGTMSGNIAMSIGDTVDGRDISADGAALDTAVSKLSGIEAGATADQTAEEIQDIVGAMLTGNTETGITVTYEDGDGTIDFVVASQTDENFTSADHTKLDGIEAGATADQTAEEIQDIVGAMLTGNTETGITVTYEDGDGTIDFVVASQTDENFTSADHTKLDGIDAGADVTLNEISAGTNISIDSSGVIDATDTNTQLSAEQVQDFVGAMVTGNTETGITVTYEDSDGTLDFVVASQTDENFTSADHTKLDGIEAGATADQTAEEIQDIVGAMLTGNTETGITVAYEDGDGTIDFTVDAAQTGITSLLATDIKIGEDDQTKIDFETADEIHFYAANVEQVYLADNVFGPESDSDVDLGTTGVRWKDAYVDSITVTGDIKGGVSVSEKTADYTLVAADNGTFISGTHANFDDLSITGDLGVGFNVSVVNPNADLDITASNSMVINGTTDGTVTLAQGYQPATIVRIASNTYAVFGNLT
jgi:hypothetical protein